jgi:hypothetical protein
MGSRPLSLRASSSHNAVEIDRMLFAMGTHIPEYRIKASIDPSDSCNLIHQDEYARRYGFSSGLVPGVTIYSYLSQSLLEFLGRNWLERGSAEATFIHPVYEGDEIRVTGCLTSVTEEGTLCVDFQGLNNNGIACMTGIATLPVLPPEAEPALREYPAGHKKLHRSISLETLKVGEELTPVTSQFSWKSHWDYCQKALTDTHPLYQQVMHPAWLLSQANLILAANYELPPWIHISSTVQHYRALSSEGEVETRGRVEARYEEKGNHCIVLDVAVFSQNLCLSTIRHTAIFRIAPQAA